MVNIQHWDEFQRAAEELYTVSPKNTRYVARYRHIDGKLVLKVTDDRTILKYKTDQMQDLNKFERLNRSLMAKMHNRIPAATASETTPASGTGPTALQTSVSTPTPAPTPSQTQAQQPTTISNSSSHHGGSGKSKRNKRK
ncbi:hypothetical protein BX616_000211 [Lobosporangium transversale]|uniref:Signal recognition particle 9 kDa protein n=1 Tax=Lobosporangium transversale TaxID=64571 RepID=A0A1Y2G915_9FUNG|nr:signal recognition particle, SRP9/SRP14 subunit [Lobosporangium transversale]KAF9917693.1 hypothetical protein BX616_000211 [Lobosporangium transversale]ORZ04586.1 signal recognition particle, SRP9/SRP14 subunit [Lobosporangium transversale]|eukprot:XP_021876632.1 signal recognition particle, SRP9/SRP14 subunit [Lobosporangium transversale]